MLKKYIVNFFKDKNGKIVIAQFPNRPLFIAAFFYAIQFINNDLTMVIGKWGFFITLMYWAYLEIVSGVNSWRKFLGLSVAIWLIWPIIKMFF